MGTSIFDGAKFGDRFVTSGAVTLIYHCANMKDGKIFYQLIDEYNSDFLFCKENGECFNQGEDNNDYWVIYKNNAKL